MSIPTAIPPTNKKPILEINCGIISQCSKFQYAFPPFNSQSRNNSTTKDLKNNVSRFFSQRIQDYLGIVFEITLPQIKLVLKLYTPHIPGSVERRIVVLPASFRNSAIIYCEIGGTEIKLALKLDTRHLTGSPERSIVAFPASFRNSPISYCSIVGNTKTS